MLKARVPRDGRAGCCPAKTPSQPGALESMHRISGARLAGQSSRGAQPPKVLDVDKYKSFFRVLCQAYRTKEVVVMNSFGSFATTPAVFVFPFAVGAQEIDDVEAYSKPMHAEIMNCVAEYKFSDSDSAIRDFDEWCPVFADALMRMR